MQNFSITKLKQQWIYLLNVLSKTVKSLLFLFISFYRSVLSSFLGGACRFEPSCSVYAEQALKKQKLRQALKLIFFRLIRCRPGGDFGLDPVPECECAHGK